MSKSRSASSLLIATLVVVVGCTNPADAVYPVHGIVRFPDGKILQNGSVEFEIQGRKEPVTARGKIRPDGTFTLGTYELADGAHAGRHRVVVISDHTIGNGAERPGLIPEPLLHPKYRDYRRSGLEYEVLPEANNLVIDVDYAHSDDDAAIAETGEPN